MHLTQRLLFASTSDIRRVMKKNLWIVRHGQAAHNPRAEAAREAGCSHMEFLELMRQDDVLDAPTTDLGKQQAFAVYKNHSWDHLDLIVSSPLTRALETADIIVPPNDNAAKRVCVEDFREINGWLLNAKRRDRSELQKAFPAWNFDEIATSDVLWTPVLEEQVDCAERGYSGLCLLLKRPEENVLLVCHGGLLRFAMNMNPKIRVVDRRNTCSNDRDVKDRFGNCELRRYELSWDGDDKNDDGTGPIVLLTEVDL